jgi:hypothetical protein
MDRVLWILLVIFLSIIASVLGATLRNALMSGKKKSLGKKRRRNRDDDDDDDDDDDRPLRTDRNAPKGNAAVVFWVLAGLGGAFLLMLVTCSIGIILTRDNGKANADGAQRDGPPPPNIEQLIEPLPEDLGPKDKQTPILGAGGSATFKDEAPPGGQLVGFEVGLGGFMDIELVKAIQPLYRTPQGESAGRKFGIEWHKRVTVKAKPGYAVGALNVKAGLLVNGFSVTFMRVKGAALDPMDSYTSPWIGDLTGGNGPTLLTGNGVPIVGIIGRHNARECAGIGLLKK